MDVRDQTTALTPSANQLSIGTDSALLLRMAASPSDAAIQAIQFVEDSIEAQNLGLELYGVGRYYGDHSYFAQHPKRREALLKRMLKRGASLDSIPYPQPINCVELLFAAMTVYRDVQLKPWGGIIGRARDSRGLGNQWVPSGRGTVLLEEARVQDGFTTWYYSRDTATDDFYHYVKKHLYGPPSGHVVKGADSHKKIDVGVHISSANNFLVNFAKAPSLLSALKDVPFALGAADWGTHTFIFSCGYIYEDHWAQGPGERVFEKKSFLDFSKEWPAGVIAAAPGSWS